MDIQIGDIDKNELSPLAARAMETEKENARLKDQKALELTQALEINTKKYNSFIEGEKIIARTLIIDREVSSLLSQNEDATVINLGCGFDNRFARVDNGKIFWYDVDLPKIITARKKAFGNQVRVTMLEGSATEHDWSVFIRKDKPAIVIAEGFSMYLSSDEVKKMLEVLRTSFPTGYLVADFADGSSDSKDFKWTADSAKEISGMDNSYQVLGEFPIAAELKKSSFRGKMFASFGKGRGSFVAVFRW